MITSRFVVFSLAMTGCAAAAFAIGRHARQPDKQAQKEELRAWEDDGGQLAPAKTPAVVRPARAA